MDLALTSAILARLPGTPEVITACNGEEVVRLAFEAMPNVIVMDWQMPAMSGIEALRKLRADPRTTEIPVVMLTGVLRETEHLRIAIEEGALDFVRKPVDPVELKARVGAALRINMSMLALRDQNVELQRINFELRTALDEIETLSGLLPICCHCREVRSDDGYWSDLESYLVVRVQTQFSHGICPSCMDTHYSDLFSDPDIEQASKVEPGVGSNRN